MGNFTDHIEYGVYSYSLTIILCIGLAYAFLWPYQLTVAILPLGLSATLLGSLTPDIDHHNSHPHKTLKFAVPLTIASSLLAALFLYFDSLYSQITMYITVASPVLGFIGFCIAIGVYFGLRYGITIFRPPHRGITHSHAFNLLTSTVVFGIVGIMFSAVGLTDVILYSTTALIAFSYAVGFLSHQLCDDMLF